MIYFKIVLFNSIIIVYFNSISKNSNSLNIKLEIIRYYIGYRNKIYLLTTSVQ